MKKQEEFPYHPPSESEREKDKLEVEEFIRRAKNGEDVEELAAGPAKAIARRHLAGPVARDSGVPIAEVAAETLEALKRWDAERRALVCIQAMWPNGIPDNFLAAQETHPEMATGRAACESVEAWKTCRSNMQGDFCPRSLMDRMRLQTHRNMADGKVEQQEYDLIMAAVRQQDPVQLKVTDPLKVIRARASGKRSTVSLMGGSEVDPLTGKQTPGSVEVYGTERLVIFGGNTGRGKTVAGAYWIARKGGLYMTEYMLHHPKRADIEKAKTASGVLVIDQVGRAPLDERRSVVASVEEIIDRRYAAHLDSVLIGNVGFEEFMVRYQKIILERVAGDGVFVLFSGASMRGEK